MSRTEDQAALSRALRFLEDLKTINPQMTLTEAIILLDVARYESGALTPDGQPTVGLSMQMIHRKHFPHKTRQAVSRAVSILETGFDPRGNGDGVQLLEVFQPPDAEDRRMKSVRLKAVARGHVLSAVRKVLPLIEGHRSNEQENHPEAQAPED